MTFRGRPAFRRGTESVGRGSSAGGRETASSPTYIMEDLGDGEPLPPTPTYTGSSPTYMDEAEPPTPTLDPDDMGLYGRADEERVALGIVETPVAIAPGTPPEGEADA